MNNKTTKLILAVVILSLVESHLHSVRSLFTSRHKIIPLDQYLPVCEPNAICKWAVCAWNRNPELILSENNCNFYSNHQCDCPEDYFCDKTDDVVVETNIVTFDFRCRPSSK